jgi:DNA-binding CsgD family transcriptional regulator
MLALAGAWTGQVGPALEALAIATPLVDGLTDRELADRIEAGANLAAAELYLDRFPDAARHAERTLAVARSSGQGHMLPAIHAVTAAAWTVAGRLREAGDVLDGAIEASRIIHDEQGLAWSLLNRSSCALHCDIDLAHDTAREAVQIARGLDRGLISVSAAIRLGIVQIELGDFARGAELIVATAGGEDVSRVPGGWRALVLESLVDARLALGDLATARATGERARAWAAEVGLPLGAASSDRIQAKLALAEDHPQDAAPLALAAAEGFDVLGARLDAGLARIEASRALAAGGERDQALALLRATADDFAACGALRRRDACDLELRRLGERVQRRGRGTNPDGDGFESLTDREREIALLVADRLTNREIAARLFLSEKTIESHMRNVFRKLGVSSRVHVARAVERMQDAAS